MPYQPRDGGIALYFKTNDMKKSRITGKAVAIFGGQIAITVGYTDSGYAVIGLSELVNEYKVGQKIKDAANYGEQIMLAFDSLESINIFREALDGAEAAIKYEGMPDDPPHGFEVAEDANRGNSVEGN